MWGAEQQGETVDAAITNGGGIRATIEAGDITKKDVNTVLPFGNTLSIIKITGTELLEVLEASTFCTPEAIGGFPRYPASSSPWTPPRATPGRRVSRHHLLRPQDHQPCDHQDRGRQGL